MEPRRIVAELNALDIPAFQGSCPSVYLEKAFDGAGLRRPSGFRWLASSARLASCSYPSLTHRRRRIRRPARRSRRCFRKLPPSARAAAPAYRKPSRRREHLGDDCAPPITAPHSIRRGFTGLPWRMTAPAPM